MPAVMVALVAAALASFGGPWWRLAAALDAESPESRARWIAPFTGLAAAILAALAGGRVAAELRGPGMLLLLALSLLFAGGAMLWPLRALRERAAGRGPAAATVLLAAAMLGDGAPFIIFAVAAWTGQPLLAGIGGALALSAAGHAATGGGVRPQDGTVRRIRFAAGAALLAAGIVAALAAFGRL